MHRIGQIIGFIAEVRCIYFLFVLEPVIVPSLKQFQSMERMQEKTAHKRETTISMYGENKIQISMCECSKGLKVFELSLSSVTHNRTVVCMHACMLACVHCAYVYRSLIVLVCFPTLALRLLLLLTFTWNWMQVALWFVTYTQVFTTYCVCVRMCACNIYNVRTCILLSIEFRDWIIENMNGANRVSAYTLTHMHIGRHVHAHADTKKHARRAES